MCQFIFAKTNVYAYKIKSSISPDNACDNKEPGCHGYLLDIRMQIGARKIPYGLSWIKIRILLWMYVLAEFRRLHR